MLLPIAVTVLGRSGTPLCVTIATAISLCPGGVISAPTPAMAARRFSRRVDEEILVHGRRCVVATQKGVGLGDDGDVDE